jgi:hypothetical protein
LFDDAELQIMGRNQPMLLTFERATLATLPAVIDLRSAAASDARERELPSALLELRQLMCGGHTAEVVWPSDRDAATAAGCLAAPLAHVVCGAQFGTSGAVVIHTRGGNVADFLTATPNAGVSFVCHLNAEEAAMRWERGDADPGRRIAGARSLSAAGWNVHVCIGAVRPFAGWRDEYADLLERMDAAGLHASAVTFPGEDIFHLCSATVKPGDGIQAIRETAGVRFGMPAKNQREIRAFFAPWLQSSRQILSEAEKLAA